MQKNEKDFVTSKGNYDNALNHLGFGSLCFLFDMAHSPVWSLMVKMHDYDNIRVFLAEAHDTSVDDFLPDFVQGFVKSNND